jgi:RNase P/RNase MRP subunit POP5
LALTRRYLLVKILGEHKITDQQFHETVDRTVRRYFGELGFARIDPRLITFNGGSSTAILSCEPSAVADLESAVALVTRESDSAMSILVLRVSGTVKAVRKRVER